MLPVFILPSLFQSPTPMLLSIFFALLGTSFPVFLPGKYGKGRTLIGWASFFLSFYTAMTIAILWIFSSIAFKKARLSFLELGSRLKKKEFIDSAEDLFFLYYDEIKTQILQVSFSKAHIQQLVKKRKKEMLDLEDIDVPELIIGEKTPPIAKRGVLHNEIYGLGVSGGYIRGRLVHIKQLDQAEKIKAGDIVAIPYSDISWTPVFSRASGIISESGGMLSHSAIVSREFSIPAIVSARNIFSVPENSEIIMDGYNGKIEVIENT